MFLRFFKVKNDNVWIKNLGYFPFSSASIVLPKVCVFLLKVVHMCCINILGLILIILSPKVFMLHIFLNYPKFVIISGFKRRSLNIICFEKLHIACQVSILVDFALQRIQNYPNDNAEKLWEVFHVTSEWIKDVNISILNLRKKSIFVPVNFNEWSKIMRQWGYLWYLPFHQF